MILAMYGDGVFAVPRPRRGADRHTKQSHPHAAVLAFLLRNYVLLCRDDTNLQRRRFYKQISVASSSSRDILFRSRREIEQELLQHFGHVDAASPVSKDASPVLRKLIQDGFNKSARLED